MPFTVRSGSISSGAAIADRAAGAFEGTNEVENDLSERTQILVPLVTLDVRLTEQFGIQAAASIPDVTRSGIVRRGTATINFSETFSGLGDTSLVGWYKRHSKPSS